MATGYIAGIYGQGPLWGLAWGGWMTSNGVTRTVARMRHSYGLDGGCFNFNQVIPIDDKIKAYQAQGVLTILLCYSLGVSFGTWYQTGHAIDLLLCIAGSELGKNYPIHEGHCGRSVLISGSGLMSDWGKKAGFSRVTEVPYVPHLLMDFAPAVCHYQRGSWPPGAAQMTEYVIVDPYNCSISRHELFDLEDAKQLAQLDRVDIGHLWGPFADQPGCGVVVYEFGLQEPPAQHKFFAIGGRLYAGRAVLFGFDRQGKTVNAPANCTYSDLNPIWLDDEYEVERAISSKLVNRPQTRLNNVTIWEWPSK